MQIIVRKAHFKINPEQFLRKANYGFVPSRTGEYSFSRRLGKGAYPRYHIYFKDDDETVTFNIHLDQKQESSFGAGHKHNAEYEGEAVEVEVARLKGLIMQVVREKK